MDANEAFSMRAFQKLGPMLVQCLRQDRLNTPQSVCCGAGRLFSTLWKEDCQLLAYASSLALPSVGSAPPYERSQARRESTTQQRTRSYGSWKASNWP